MDEAKTIQEQGGAAPFSRAHWIALGALALVYAAVAIAQWSPGYIDFGDGNYMYIGWRIASGDVVYRDILAPQPPCHLFLGAAVYKISAWIGLEAKALYAFRFMSLILRLTAFGLIFDLARRAWGRPWAGVAAGAIFLWLPIGYWWAMAWQSEPLEIVFLLAMLRTALTKTRKGDALAGVFAALAALTNATAAPFLLVLIVFMAIRTPRRTLRMLPSCLILAAAVTGALEIWTGGEFLNNVVFNQVGTFPTGPVTYLRSDVTDREKLMTSLRDNAPETTALRESLSPETRAMLDNWKSGDLAEELEASILGDFNDSIFHQGQTADGPREDREAAIAARRSEIDAALPGALKPYSPMKFFLGYAAGKLKSQGAKILYWEGAAIVLSLAGLILFMGASPLPSPMRGGLFCFCVVTFGSIFYVTKGGTMDYIFSLAEPAVALMGGGAAAMGFEHARANKKWRPALGVAALVLLAGALVPAAQFYRMLFTQRMYELPADRAAKVVEQIEKLSPPDGPILAPPFYAFMARRPLWGHYSELFIWNMNYINDRNAGDKAGAGALKIAAMSRALEARTIPLAVLEMDQTGRIPEVVRAVRSNYIPLYDAPFRTLNTRLGFFVPCNASPVASVNAEKRWGAFWGNMR